MPNIVSRRPFCRTRPQREGRKLRFLYHPCRGTLSRHSLAHILVRKVPPRLREGEDLTTQLLKTDARQLAVERLLPRRFSRQLCSMPACNHPDGLVLATVKKTIWRNDNLTKGKIWKLWNESAGLQISREPSQHALSLPAEPDGCPWLVLRDIGHRLQKLGSPGGCEPDFHFGPPPRRASASASTSSKSNPLPAVISCSPRARRCRSWRSRSLRS